MSINPSDDFDKISKIFKSLDDARNSFFKKNSSLDDVLLSRLQDLVDKHLLSPFGNYAVSEILVELNSLKEKKLKDLTQDQDLVLIGLSLAGLKENLNPKTDFEVFKSLFNNFLKIASETRNHTKTLKESFFPLLDEAKELLKERESKRALNLIKEKLIKYSESKIKDLKPASPSFEVIAKILKENLVIYEDEGFVSIESNENTTGIIPQLRWNSKEEVLKSHKIFRSILLNSFQSSVKQAVDSGFCGDQKNIQINNVKDGECHVRLKDEFDLDLFYNAMIKAEPDITIKGSNYPTFSVFNADHVISFRRNHLEINFREDQAIESYVINDKKTLENFILKAASFTGFNPSTKDHQTLFLALLNCTTQTNGNLFFTKFKGIMSFFNLEFLDIFEKHYKKDTKESIEFTQDSKDGLKVSFQISESLSLKQSPEEVSAIVTSVKGSYTINLSGDKIFLNDIDVEGRVFIPE